MKKLLTALLTAILLVVSLSSCASKNNQNNTESTSSNEKKPGNIYYQEDGLPEKNFNGADFVFLTATDITGGEMTSMDSEDVSDPLVSSIHLRTQYVEDRFSVDISDYRKHYSETYSAIYTSVNAQDYAFDACYGFITWMFPLSIDGCFTEYADIPYVDLSKEWWDQGAKKAFSIGNRIFYMTGDANMFYNDYTWVLYFNKEILKEIQENEPYDLVDSGDWTIDEMYRLGVKAVKNLDSDPTIDPNTDRVGMVTHQYTANALVYGCNELFFQKNSEDLPEISFESNRFQNVCEKVTQLFHNDNFMYDTTENNGNGANIEDTFSSGRALFCGEVLQCARRYRGMETDFGILPYPKYDSEQKDYITYSLEMVYPVAIPSYFTSSDLEKAGIILEAMQSASHNSVMSAYFDAALTSKRFLRDERSEDMLKIIFDTRCYPLATMKDFGGCVSQIVYNIRTNNPSFSSFIASNKSKTVGEINELIEKLSNL